jgi:hypothetical protein
MNETAEHNLLELINEPLIKEPLLNNLLQPTSLEILTDENILELILTVFSVGLVTGGMIFILSLAVSHALGIFKSI